MVEISKACRDSGAPPEFLRALAVCALMSEDEYAIVLKAPDGADAELLAHNVGASLAKHCKVNHWTHEHNSRHRCGPTQ